LEGQADVFLLLRGGTKKWDTCAGAALLAEAGGVLTDSGGRRMQNAFLQTEVRRVVAAD
jgi:3'-phosphoadenosine 5'-phosphosulfate (PAPS) 3'-phosphatase